MTSEVQCESSYNEFTAQCPRKQTENGAGPARLMRFRPTDVQQPMAVHQGVCDGFRLKSRMSGQLKKEQFVINTVKLSRIG